MLTEGQINYLSKLDLERANAPVFISAYNPKTEVIAENVINKIKKILPGSDIQYMGASALKISGQNDVDIYIITPNEIKREYFSKLNSLFGEQIKNKWQWNEKGVEVSVYLSDPEDKKFQEQLDIFNLFKSNPDVLEEYEALKNSLNGKTYKEYQTGKYEFYNRVLGIN